MRGFQTSVNHLFRIFPLESDGRYRFLPIFTVAIYISSPPRFSGEANYIKGCGNLASVSR